MAEKIAASFDLSNLAATEDRKINDCDGASVAKVYYKSAPRKGLYAVSSSVVPLESRCRHRRRFEAVSIWRQSSTRAAGRIFSFDLMISGDLRLSGPVHSDRRGRL
jgi:hypothetical protein